MEEGMNSRPTTPRLNIRPTTPRLKNIRQWLQERRGLHSRFIPTGRPGTATLVKIRPRDQATLVKIPPRDLTISQSETSQCWTWTRDPSSGEEVAEMMDLCRLEIKGKFDCKDLTPGKTYAAYLIFQIAEESSGLSSPYQDARVAWGTHEQKPCAVCLDTSEGKKKHEDGVRLPRKRKDGWMEIELGEFPGDAGEVDMSLSETKVMNWKKGLIVGGIEIRLKN